MSRGGAAAHRVERGRPARFDRDKVVDRSVDLFWRQGYTGATTRVLEAELGVGQSSLYNAFGSKQGLLDEAVERYNDRLEAEVLASLTVDGANRHSILAFLDAITAWICRSDTSGCLVLNLAAEHPDQAHRVADYRSRLAALLRPAVATFTDEGEVETRVDVLVVAVFGLNILASSGANRTEIESISASVRELVTSW